MFKDGLKFLLMLMLFLTGESHDDYGQCVPDKALQIVYFIQAINGRSIYLIYDKVIIKSTLDQYQTSISSITHQLTDNSKDIPPLPNAYGNVIVVWVTNIDEWEKILNDDAFCTPCVIKQRTVLFLMNLSMKKFLTGNLLSKLSDFIIWRQNDVYFLVYDNAEKCNEYHYQKYHYDKQLHQVYKIDCLGFVCDLYSGNTTVIPIQEQNITVGINPYMPDALIDKDANNKTIFGGFVYDLLYYYLCPMMKLRMIEVYADQLPPPGDNEIIRDMIQRGELDTTTTPYILSANKVPIVDFVTVAMKFDHIGLGLRDSFSINEFKWTIFLQPLHWSCWIMIFVVESIYYIFTKILKRSKHKHICAENILKISNLLMIFCLMSTYGACIYASLTVTPNLNPYESLEDVMNDGRFYFYAHTNHYMHITLQGAKAGKLRDLWEIMKKTPDEGKISDKAEAYNRLFTGYNVFLHYTDLFGHDLKNNCSFHLIKTPYQIALNIGFNKRSKYTELFNQNLLLVKEFGLLGKEEAIYKPQRICLADNSVGSISIYHMISAYVALLIGIAISTLAFLFEIARNTFVKN